MTILRTGPNRISQLPFSWDARDLSLTARSGQVGTMVRPAGGATPYALGKDGIFYPVIGTQPRWSWFASNGDGVLDSVGLRCEQPSYVPTLGACSFADESFWHKTGTVSWTPVKSMIAGKTAYSHANDGTSYGQRYQSTGVTFATGRTDFFGVLVEQGSGASTQVNIYDGTTAQTVGFALLTWSTLAIATGGSGTIAARGVTPLPTGPNGGKAAILWLTVTGTATGAGGNGHACTVVWEVTGAADTLTTIIHAAWFISNQAYPVFPVVSAGSPVTLNQDYLKFTLPGLTPQFIDSVGGLTTLFEMQRPSYADITTDIVKYPGQFVFGHNGTTDTPAANLSCYMHGQSATANIRNPDSSHQIGQSVALPSGGTIKVAAQWQHLTTAPRVAVSVGGPFSLITGSAAAFAAFGSQDLFIGTGCTVAQGVAAAMARMKMLFGLQDFATIDNAY